jgi:DNA polymerase/3'-5' exonuclease PolX
MNYEQLDSKIYSVIELDIERYVTVGSLRRKKKEVNDIDIVIQPVSGISVFNIISEIMKYFDIHKQENYPDCFSFVIDNVPVQIYIAPTEQAFEVLKLVRTGDIGFLAKLHNMAHQKGMILRCHRQFGLFKLHKIPGHDKRDVHYTYNPKHPEIWKERDIIEYVFGTWIPPEERNYSIEKQPDISNTEIQEQMDIVSHIKVKFKK